MHIELLLFIVGLTSVIAGCLAPTHWIPPLPHDKLLHFLAFAGLSLLAGRIAQTRLELLIWLSGLLVVGLIIEALQSKIPGRNFCWGDIAANAAGTLVAALGARAVVGL